MRIPWRAYAPDIVPPLVISAVVLVGATSAPGGRIPLDPVGYAFLLGGALSLVVRRRRPPIALVISTLCVLGYLVRGYPGVAPAVPVMGALFTAVRRGHRRVAVLPFLALAAVVPVDRAYAHGEAAQLVFQDRFLLAGWLVASAGLGEAFRQRDAYVSQVDERAADAERTREETARRRAADERLRIARELHDSLTHSISIIKLQTSVAIHLARKRGEEVPETLLAVQEASGEAMRELRATLGVLRRTDADGPDTGLARLPDLVARARTGGLPITVTVDGAERALPADVDRAAYRVVQEALTNASRHAGPASASVRVEYRSDRLTVRVDDDGLATVTRPPTPGYGLAGMRERVTALGGTLRAEPRPQGGFSVCAELPLPAPGAAQEAATAARTTP